MRAMAEALLIGFLVGAQREAALGERYPGIRDFLLIALVGALCGLLGQPWFAVASLGAITLLLAVFHFQITERAGITTEMAAIATFWFGYLATTPYATLAIGLTIVVVTALEFKQWLHRLVRETITVGEFNDTLRFLALVFVIYPLLPAGDFGPYHFFSPRQVWLFVILVSSISYVGYFLTKFLGESKGLELASLLGGLASSTAATAAFAKGCHEEPEKLREYWQATLIANAVMGPRSLIVIYAVAPELGRASLAMLMAMAAVGLAFAWVVSRGRRPAAGREAPAGQQIELRNPFRVLPALEFGAFFAVILLIGKAAAARMGGASAYWTSAIGGSVNVDAVSVTLADLLHHAQISLPIGVVGVLVAWASNAVVKSAIAAVAGSAAFGWRVATGFVVMFGAGVAVLLMVR